MIGLAKKWRIFLWLLSPIQFEWGSSRMCGDNSPMWFLTCTRRRSLKNIRQESWTPSLVSFAGSNLTFISLCVCLVFLPWWYFHSACSWYGQTCHWRWLHSHDRKMSLWTAGTYWSLEKDMLVVLGAAGLSETGVLCALMWWFTHLAFGWWSDGQSVVYCCIASKESDNVPYLPCPLLLGRPLDVQVYD